MRAVSKPVARMIPVKLTHSAFGDMEVLPRMKYMRPGTDLNVSVKESLSPGEKRSPSSISKVESGLPGWVPAISSPKFDTPSPS